MGSKHRNFMFDGFWCGAIYQVGVLLLSRWTSPDQPRWHWGWGLACIAAALALLAVTWRAASRADRAAVVVFQAKIDRSREEFYQTPRGGDRWQA